MDKRESIDEGKLEPLATDHGDCFATDRVAIDGQSVGYMYREAPEFDADSGWRFFAGDESQEYLDNPQNLGIYDVNTIANFDTDIIPFLGAPVGSEFGRDATNGEIREIVDAISADFSNFRLLRDAVGEMSQQEGRTPAASAR